MSEQGRREAMAVLDAWAGDPREGLPEELFLFISRLVPVINVDLLIQDERGRTLLTWREDEFYGAGWHVPGGIIRYGELPADRIHATAVRELGCDVEFDAEPMAVEPFLNPARRERGHFVSLVYRCRLRGEPDASLRYESGKPERDQWAWHERAPRDLIAAQDHYRRFFS